MRKTDGTYTVYAIRCKENGRVYVGCTSNVDSRIRSHFSELARGEKTECVGPSKREASQWQQDYNQYGKDAFELYILESGIPAEMKREREDYFARLYKATDRRFGYCLRPPIIRRQELHYEVGLPPLPYLNGGETDDGCGD